MGTFIPRFLRHLRDVVITTPSDSEVLTYDSADGKWKNEAGGGGGGPPTGAAGGVLGGTYPNPGFDVDMATQAELDAHVTDITDAHDATAVSVAPFGTIAATQVQAALEEIVAEASTGAPTTADYLVGTADGGLSNEIVVGASPGGELGGTWASPTVDATHSGSSHAGVQTAAEATAQTALDAHTGDATDAHDASSISIVDAAGDFTAIEVEGALAELQTADEADEAALAAHLVDGSDAHAGSAITNTPAGGIAATTLQGAINELDSEKQPLDADLTAIAALADPNADRILFWDDSLGAYTFLTPGTNLTITSTTIDAAGDLSAALILAPATDARNVVQPTAATIVALTLKGAASQSDDLLQLKTSADVTLSHIDSAGRLRVPVGSLAEAGIGFLADPNTGIFSPAADQLSVVAGGVEVVRVMSSGRVGIGLGGGTPNVPLDIGIGGINAPTYMIGYGNLFTANSGWMQYLQAAQTAIMLSGVPIYVTKNLQLAPTNAQVVSTLLYVDLVGAASAAWTGFKIRGAASQSESLQEWHTSADAILGRVNKDGYFMTRKIAAPAAADLAPGEVTIWLDPTNGAGKLMATGKTLDGTVVTGSLGDLT